ncbi:hypothetical protein GE09DRAFT_967472 [Coniochaeta sp. 2T2.1]|nr:hypothetical protein GE09DRAFT_967472 [Coniochaeta sp. 2T2.1]
MVSFWPWRRQDSSPASFEKTLSTLSKKITATQAQLDSARSTSRRMRVLWTLYLSFAYLVYAIVLFMVVGFKNLGPIEWTGVSGGPVLIYLIRTAVTAFFNFRIDTLTARLKDHQSEREKTIQKLKDATKYDTTLELLEKYGGSENKTKKGRKGVEEDDAAGGQGKKNTGGKGGRRTNIPPPATANIPRAGPQGKGSAPGTPQPGAPQGPFGPPQHRHPQQQHLAPHPPQGLEPSAEFAPNAFGPGSEPPTTNYAPVQRIPGQAHWYDKVMELLLGEDETAAKNRIVLICQRCRLVNGQAPPGTKSLDEVGSWRCMGCGTMNGEIDEGKRIVDEVLAKQAGVKVEAPASTDGNTDDGPVWDDESDLVEVESVGSPPPVKKEQKGKKKGGK